MELRFVARILKKMKKCLKRRESILHEMPKREGHVQKHKNSKRFLINMRAPVVGILKIKPNQRRNCNREKYFAMWLAGFGSLLLQKRAGNV
jgi:hypothetical protein